MSHTARDRDQTGPGPGQLALIVMGVSGSGKTRIAVDVARRLGWDFEEGDSLHPPENVAKMSSGHPLTDADRWPWLAVIGAHLDAAAARGAGCIVTCSALKRRYRDVLRARRPQVRFVHLAGTRAVIAARLAARQGHFMPAGLLDSQLGDLERLDVDEPGTVIDIAPGPDEIVAAIMSWLTTVEGIRS